MNLLTRLYRNLRRETREEMMDAEEPGRVLIAGLGNPGRKHQYNRHNVGFMAVDHIAEAYDIDLTRSQKKALFGSGHIMGAPVLMAKPQTYMNRSGDALGPLTDYYRIEPGRLLVIYDDLDLPLGTLRLRDAGGAGGHNGMKSIIQHVGNDFPRLRLGIGRPPGRMPPAAYVLQDFGEDEIALVREVLDHAREAVETFLSEGIELAMSRHNGSVTESET